ncbi:hypothetical protein WR25_10174 [Diploscapter pachys]|uniref:Uncharacterized protein n=1 Tax=Diploscapter pachys TaxID=2018661 RepID=A0A2A2KM27_9BILA|nr:hypothetical protein WR25_10174 [Diploscapter pachys]
MAVSLFRLRQICIVLIVCLSVFYLLSAGWTYNHIDLEKSDWVVKQKNSKLVNESPLSGSDPTPNKQKSASLLKHDDINVVIVNSDSRISADAGANRATSNVTTTYSFNQTKCNIPKLNIDSPEVSHFFKPATPLNCNKAASNWVYLDQDGKVVFSKERKSARCSISYFQRKDDNTNSYEPYVDLHEGDLMKQDFARVKCMDGIHKWSSLLMSIAENGSLKKKLEDKKSDNPNVLDVYFLGFDSLSQMSFRRKLKKTVTVLEDIIGSVVLNGYNIVGDGTPQAFIPILTAQTEVELPLTRKRFKEANYVDDVYPFIWKNFSDAGYVTAYGEDAFNIGTFTYRLKGFRYQPTDHYTRTFFKDVEESIGYGVRCIGSVPLHRRLPFFSISLPRRFRNTDIGALMHKNLLSNVDRLSTPFDIHATLMDILHVPSLEQLRTVQNPSQKRSLSLFRPMTEDRSCDQAGVEPHWCSCLDWQDSLKEPEDAAISNKLANIVVQVINEQLKNVTDLCAPLLLDNLIQAKKLVPNSGVLHYKNVKDADGFVTDLSGSTKATFAHFQLKLQTKPGNAIYEITLFYDYTLKKATVDLNSISHVNKFGDAPHCIIDSNYFLATYCVCYDKIN